MKNTLKYILSHLREELSFKSKYKMVPKSYFINFHKMRNHGVIDIDMHRKIVNDEKE